MTNRVEVKGNLGRDAEVKTYGPENKEMVILHIAASNAYKDSNTNQWVQRDPTWLRVPVFKPAAVKAARNMKKGDLIEILGGLKAGEYTDPNTGEVKYSLEVVVQDRYHTVRVPGARQAPSQGEAA